MKKIVVFIIVLVMTTGFVIAQDSGFSFGAEIGVTDFQEPYYRDELINDIYIMPTLSYKGFMTDALEINAELGVPFWILPDLWLGIDLDLKLTYNMGNLSIIAENFLKIPVIKDARNPHSPLFSKGNHFSTFSDFFYPSNRGSETYDFLSPGVKYDLFFNTGTLYLQADLPFLFIPDAFKYAYLNLSAGWKSENGFGLKIKEYNVLKQPSDEIKFFQRLDLTASYETDTFSGELDIGVPFWDYNSYTKAMEVYGVTIIPKVEFRLANDFKVYGNLPIYRLGSDNDMMFGLAIGVKRSV